MSLRYPLFLVFVLVTAIVAVTLLAHTHKGRIHAHEHFYMRQQMHAPCVCATQKPKVQAKGPKWLSERQTATRVPKKKGQNDVGSEINEKIIIVTPASEMWQEGGSKTPPQNRISLGIQVSICHPTKRSGKHQSSEKRKARPRMTKRRRKNHSRRTTADIDSERWQSAWRQGENYA